MGQKFISFKESMKILEDSMKTLKLTEKIFTADALGRVLAKDIVADKNSPEFATSAMDGYAIRYEDQKLKKLKIVDLVPAGKEAKREIQKGECVKTFTGSLMCKGSDTLIPIENVEVKDGYIFIKEEVEKGFSVRPVGENFKKGEILIKSGSKISFAEIGVLASLNKVLVEVYKKPLVSIIATGSEILDLGEERENSSQIYSSNHYTLEAIAKMEGAEVIRVGCVGDNKDLIKSKIVEALKRSDIVVTTGGVSVGDFDFVKDILKSMDVEYLIEGVVIKPGQHIKVVRVGEKYIFALPGFPYSSAVTFYLYVVPLIRKMQGLSNKLLKVFATLKEDYKKRSKKEEFTAVNISYEEGEFFVDLKGKKSGSSAILTNMLNNTALMHIPQNEGDKKKGEKVEVILFSMEFLRR